MMLPLPYFPTLLELVAANSADACPCAPTVIRVHEFTCSYAHTPTRPPTHTRARTRTQMHFSYELQEAKLKQEIASEMKQIELITKQKQTEIGTQEVTISPSLSPAEAQPTT
jgi:hypothetical protein